MDVGLAKPLVAQRHPGVLRLPGTLRHRIYLHFGLASWDGRPYTIDLHGRKACRGTPAPGTIAAAVLYSANRFIIYYSHPGSLEPLRALTPRSVASLADLTVTLNQTSCVHPSPWGDDTSRACCLVWLPEIENGIEYDDPYCLRKQPNHLHDPALLSTDPGGNHDGWAAAQVMLKEWHSTAAYLSCYFRPGAFKSLAFVCDIEPEHERAAEAAECTVAPLRFLPPLRESHVRLCKTPDPRLCQLSQDAVLHARQLTAPYSKPSSTLTTLTMLPRELRLRILEYTDLITPRREVSWGRLRGAYMAAHATCYESDAEDEAHPDIHHGCQFSDCWFNNSDEPWVGCFCRRRHAASSSTCKCWPPPGPDLFLICRTLYHDAQLVFFSGNRFVVHDALDDGPETVPIPLSEPHRPSGCGLSESGYLYERLGASIFLREVVPTHCLAYLRFLELVFPPYPRHLWPKATHPAARDWQATVDWLRGKINAPGLTMRLATARPGDDWNHDTEEPLRHDGIARLARAEDDDGGLAGFYVRLTYPWGWTQASIKAQRQLIGHEWLEDMEEEISKCAERDVLGERRLASV
ncbi:hypothetical protein N658DRAFT_515047 [Parathielavia hyrcaniae]|uniref:Uncharacterized protein n=1 Tax=Parathielavia hyrcaniae TaxID=113614 RepID=A0AAN6Q3K7_9PEZI|nr:hypothetical protein N658DRAFT_515047 [Parathielavia hyrcaniae]